MGKKGWNICMLLGARALAVFLIAALLLMGTAMGEISRTELVAEWHFDGDAKDSSGNGNDGTIFGATFVDGKFGKALSFNGANDYADFGEGNGKLDFGTGPFSIEFWMNYKGITRINPNYAADIMGKTLGNANTPGYLAWITTWGGDGSNYGLFIETSTGPWQSGNAEHWGAYFPDTWYHLVFVRNDNTWTVYKNGVNAHSETKDGMGLSVDNNVNFKIGDSTGEANFTGLIDEVRIYNSALSAGEIKSSYEAGQITITSSISGAEVFIDGVFRGKASPNFTISDIAPGLHTVTCSYSGYGDNVTQINLPASSTASITCNLLPALGRISITSSPSGADVYLDGASKGTAPVILNEISPGKHVIWCKKTGFEDLQQSIEVTSGNVAIVACALVQTPTPTSIPTTGSLSVFSMPSGASIYLDTVYKGDTPNTITGVSTGTHNIELKFEGFKPWVDSINVEAGSTSKVSASLVPAIPTVTTPPLTLTTLTPTPTIIIPTLTSTPPITGPSRDLVSIMAVLLIIMGSVLTSLTTIKKDISLEVGVSERSLKYVGGAGILLIAIGAYLLLKAYDLT